jgi:hypothetical protein
VGKGAKEIEAFMNPKLAVGGGQDLMTRVEI